MTYLAHTQQRRHVIHVVEAAHRRERIRLARTGGPHGDKHREQRQRACRNRGRQSGGGSGGGGGGGGGFDEDER